MVEGGGGALMNVSATSRSPLRRFAHYAAAKAGLLQFTRTPALEYGQSGLRVNVDLPERDRHSDVPGDHGRHAQGGPRRPAQPAGIRQLALAEEVAAAAIFLASDDASSLTGVVLPTDGGTWPAESTSEPAPGHVPRPAGCGPAASGRSPPSRSRASDEDARSPLRSATASASWAARRASAGRLPSSSTRARVSSVEV